MCDACLALGSPWLPQLHGGEPRPRKPAAFQLRTKSSRPRKPRRSPQKPPEV